VPEVSRLYPEISIVMMTGFAPNGFAWPMLLDRRTRCQIGSDIRRDGWPVSSDDPPRAGQHIFVEVLPQTRDDLAALNDILCEGYVDVHLPDGAPSVHDRISHDPAAWNHALVPHERLAAFLTIQ
jgi:hypothetical protein